MTTTDLAVSHWLNIVCPFLLVVRLLCLDWRLFIIQHVVLDRPFIKTPVLQKTVFFTEAEDDDVMVLCLDQISLIIKHVVLDRPFVKTPIQKIAFSLKLRWWCDGGWSPPLPWLRIFNYPTCPDGTPLCQRSNLFSEITESLLSPPSLWGVDGCESGWRKILVNILKLHTSTQIGWDYL